MMMMREGVRMMMIVGLQGSEGSLDDRCVVMLMRWFFSMWHLGFDFSQLHEHGAYSRKWGACMLGHRLMLGHLMRRSGTIVLRPGPLLKLSFHGAQRHLVRMLQLAQRVHLL